MAKRSIVPFGPQHPVLPEPIHLDLVLEDETVVGAVPSIGYVHRGLETLVKKKDFKQYVYIAERICGICSCGHGLGYCMAVENVMGIEVPERAQYLRVIWVEMSRIHSHLLWLGLLADALGFESLFMESWRVREKILDMFDETTGGRIIHSVNQVGGVQRDMDSAMLKHLLETIRDIERDLKPLVDTFLKDYTVQSRLKGTGILKKMTPFFSARWDRCSGPAAWNMTPECWGTAHTNTCQWNRSYPLTETAMDAARCGLRNCSSPLH